MGRGDSQTVMRDIIHRREKGGSKIITVKKVIQTAVSKRISCVVETIG